MLKRSANIIMAILLLFATSGVTIYRHYCCGSFVGTSLYSVPGHCCKTDCPGCRNEIINLRIADQFESNSTQADFKADFKTLFSQHSLPVLLAFSTTHQIAFYQDTQGDHSLKPDLVTPGYAGNPYAFLQVFLL
jgi:hypothetical protein